MIASLLLLAGSGSSTLLVPTDHATIQAAIDAAVTGDIVLVLPGDYDEEIDFLGKEIVVESAEGPAVTAITGLDDPPKVSLINGEGPAAVIRGFTIRGGNDFLGAAVRCIGSSPTIEGNVIRDNSGGPTGGAVYCLDGSPTIVGNEFTDNTEPGILVAGSATPLIEANTFYRNDSTGIFVSGGSPLIRANVFVQNDSPNNGGGIRSQTCSMTVEHNLFVENRSSRGSGVFVGTGTVATIRDNEFSYNDSYFHGNEGGAVHVTGAAATIERNAMFANRAEYGGGIAVTGGSDAQIRDNEIRDGWAFREGGGIYVDDSVVVIERCRIVDNVCYAEPGFTSRGGGVSSAGVLTLRIRQCEITGCTATRGAALQVAGLGIHELVGLTLADNTPTVGGVIEVTTPAIPTLASSIVWGNSGPSISGTGVVNASWCDVEGGIAGASIVDVDPLFVDAAGGDYRLADGSPCVDAGDPASPPSGLDASSAPRHVDGDLDLDVRIDLGAYERTHVRMAPIGSVAPGGSFTIEATGEPGLLAACALGFGASEVFLDPWGALLLDPFQLILPVHTTASLPFSLPASVAPDYVGPTSSWFQTIVLDPSTGAGNLSNRVELVVE